MHISRLYHFFLKMTIDDNRWRAHAHIAGLETRPSPSSTRACSVSYNYAWEYFLLPTKILPRRVITIYIDGEREQANWDMAELQSVPFSFRNKTGRAAYCKKIIESMCVKLRYLPYTLSSSVVAACAKKRPFQQDDKLHA